MFRYVWLSTSVLALGYCAAAQTQSAQPESENESGEAKLGKIVVTAERRNQDLQTAPIAASVLTGDELANLGVVNVDQLQFIAPSATVNNFGQGNNFNIRGIGKAESNTQTTTGVITYRDGVATFPGYFTNEPYYDVASVEILRGPQGTFVGQNATGGAVFVSTRDPEINGGYTGYVQAEAGNYSHFGGEGAVNIPLTDTLAGRLAFHTRHRDSFYDISGPYSGDDGVETYSLRGSVLWEPTSALSVSFKTDLNYLDLSAYPADPVNSTSDFFDITANADMEALDRGVRSVLEINYEFENGVELRSVSGYQDALTKYKADLDGTSTGNNTFRDSVEETIKSQEINLISPEDQRFRWILGAYLQTDVYNFLPDAFVIGAPPGSPTTEYVLDGKNPKQTNAVFGQVSYDLTDRLEVQLGARYTEQSTTNNIFVEQYGTPIEQNQTEEYSNLSGKLAVNWAVTDEHFLYAFYATGYRPGGLNVPVNVGGVPEPFEEEIVKSYEAGWKAEWFDNRVRTQLTGFYNDYDNFQVRIGYPDLPVFAIELNTPETTTMYGGEAEVQAALGDLSVNAGISVLHSELGEFYAVDPRTALTLVPCDPETGPEGGLCQALGGREQTYAPEFTFNIGAQYVFEVGEDDRIIPRINYGHVGEQWATLFQDETRGDRLGSRNVVNAQLAWTHGDIVTTLYATNLTDERYLGAINSGLRYAGPPRQYGIRVMKTF